MNKKRRKGLKAADKRLFMGIIILALLLETVFLRADYNERLNKKQNDARVYGESVSSAVELIIQQAITGTEIMKRAYEAYPDSFDYQFGMICDSLVLENDSISSMYVAPNGIVQWAYPEKVNESTIGYNMLDDPEQGPMAQLAVDTKDITVAGPHNLVEGGKGFIVRNPIFDSDGNFVAFTIIIMNWDVFEENLMEEIGSNDSGYNFAIWKSDNAHIVTDDYGFILNASGKNISKDIDITINIPNDKWHLAIEPKNGWNVFRTMIPEIIASIVVLLLVVFGSYLKLKNDNKILNNIEFDELTGVYSRQAFYQHVKSVIDKNPNNSYDIVVADVENFKLINGIYGESVGDEVLKYLADVFVRHLPTEGMCARIGADQFAGFLPANPGHMTEWVQGIIEDVERKSPIQNMVVKYGLYDDVDHCIPVATMCDRALLSVKSIKHNFEVAYAKYDGPISMKQVKARNFETKFEDALRNKEFVVWYQPKFDAKTEKLVSAEALVRWKKGDGTMVPPGEFIPVFEDDGLIVRLDEYVFRRVCEDINRWNEEGLEIIPISVNLSRASLYHEDTVDRYKGIAGEVGVSTDFVPIELTESAAVFTNRIDQLTKNLKVAGFQLHMDDFGSGMSSLASINVLPFDVIKIDKTLVDGIGTPGGDELIKFTIALAHFKNMTVVAEGVETREQLELLRDLGCDVIQGYYFSAPKSYEDYTKFIKSVK